MATAGIRKHGPDGQLEPQSSDRSQTTLLNELSALPSDVVLVLDDYHVIDAQAITGRMTFLLDHLPHRSTW